MLQPFCRQACAQSMASGTGSPMASGSCRHRESRLEGAAGTLELLLGGRTDGQLRAGVRSVVMCGWQAEVAVSLCVLQGPMKRGHPTQATGRQALLQLSCGSCRQACGDEAVPLCCLWHKMGHGWRLEAAGR